jgi:sec-independent protein translocase protein TatB
MSLPDTIFIFVLALIIFGPKKLPEIGRQLGKLVGEFRRASNEFKFQIEEELRQADLADRRKAAPTIAPPATEALPGPALDEARRNIPADHESPDTVLPAGQYPNPEYLVSDAPPATPAAESAPPEPPAETSTLTVAVAAGAQPRSAAPFAPPAAASPETTADAKPAEIAHG